jgi:hypothetical protein
LQEVTGALKASISSTNASLTDAMATHAHLAEEIKLLQLLIADNKTAYDAGVLLVLT